MINNKAFATALVVSIILLGAASISNTLSFQQQHTRFSDDGPFPSTAELTAGFTAHGLTLHPAQYWTAQ